MLAKLLMKLPAVKRLAEAKHSADKEVIREMPANLDGQIRNAKNDREAVVTHLQKEHDRLLTELEKARSRPLLSWPKPAKAIPANEVRRAFAVPMDAPLWQALHQVLDQAIQGAVDEATQQPSATQTGERRTYMAGGVDALREFQGRLLELQASANREDADLQEGEEKA